MDELIDKKNWSTYRMATLGLAGFVVAAIVYALLTGTGSSSLSIDSDRISVDRVQVGEFEEYVRITGRVQPKITVYLDLEEGGIVEQIFIESGNWVDGGDLILGLSNTMVQKNNIDSETRLLENLDSLRNSKISATQQGLILKDQMLDLNFDILELERLFERHETLNAQRNTNLSKEEFEATRDRLRYLKDKKVLLEERIRQETTLRDQQARRIDDSIERGSRSLQMLTQIMESLTLRAPISGYLSSMDAEVGQSFSRGQLGVAESSYVPGGSVNPTFAFIEDSVGEQNQQAVGRIEVSHEFVDVMGIEMVKGRPLSDQLLTDQRKSILVNESLSQFMGWDQRLEGN